MVLCNSSQAEYNRLCHGGTTRAWWTHWLNSCLLTSLQPYWLLSFFSYMSGRLMPLATVYSVSPITSTAYFLTFFKSFCKWHLLRKTSPTTLNCNPCQYSLSIFSVFLLCIYPTYILYILLINCVFLFSHWNGSIKIARLSIVLFVAKASISGTLYMPNKYEPCWV